MKKALVIIGLVIFLLLAAVLILPFVFKGRIVELVKKAANEQLNARVDFDNDITLSLIQNFPDFTLGIQKITVIGVDSFAQDTLISMDEFKATLDVMSVINGGAIKIQEVLLDQPRIYAHVLPGGKANWDITKPDTTAEETKTDTAATSFQISLKQFSIRNAFITYHDEQGGMLAVIDDFSHELTGDFSQDQSVLNTRNSIQAITFSQSGLTYLSKVAFELNASIDADLKNKKYTIQDNTIRLNELKFAIEGWVAQVGEKLDMDIKFNAAQAEFKQFLSLIPAIYSKDFASIKTSGKLAFDAGAKGTFFEEQLPSFYFNLNVDDARFQYPELPVPVTGIHIDFSVKNPDGIKNNTEVQLKKFAFNISGDPFNAGFIARNLMVDPFIDAYFKGKLNLDNITKIVPLDKGMQVSGKVETDMHMKGNLSTLEKKQYEQFDAAGTILVSGLVFASPDLPKQFRLQEAAVSLSPRIVKLSKFDAGLGASDFSMNGELSNFIAYAFGKGVLGGTVNFTSKSINLNELMGEPKPDAQQATADTGSLQAPAIPHDVVLILNATIGKMLYTNMEITNFNGQVKIEDSRLNLNKIRLNTLGSAMGLDGFYENHQGKNPRVEMNFTIDNLDINKAAVTFNTVKKLAPVAENMRGTFTSMFFMKTAMDQQLNPDYESLFAEGKLSIPKADFKDVKIFNKAAELLHYDKLKDPSINNLNIQFKVEKGRIHTQPFDMNISGQKLVLSGSSGLDQTIDYTGTMKLPKSAMGAAGSAVNKLLEQANAKAGTQIKTSESVDIGLKITGTFSSPKISTNLADIAKSETKNLTRQLAEEAEKKKKELEAKAKAEADRLKKEAEAKTKAELDKAKAEAERLKKEAEAKTKAEQERLKKQAEEEAKKKLKGLFK